jgi:hypothetical protein
MSPELRWMTVNTRMTTDPSRLGVRPALVQQNHVASQEFCCARKGSIMRFMARFRVFGLLTAGLILACHSSRGLRSSDASAPPAVTPAVECAALQALADRDLLIPRRTKQVVYAPDRSWLVLLVDSDGDGGTSRAGDVIRVRLPSGEVTPLASAMDDVEALGTKGALLLAREAAAGGEVFVADDSGLRTIATRACEHRATPDGTRVYILRDCQPDGSGALDVVHTASGEAKPLGTSGMWNRGVQVSPGGTWVVFPTRQSADGNNIEYMNLADSAGNIYTLSSQPGASDPSFISDRLLLFQIYVNGKPKDNPEIRGHVPGTGDSSYRIAIGLDPHGYEISPDRTLLLGSGPLGNDSQIAKLYAIRLDGSGERLLASDLCPFWRYSRVLRGFAFSPSGADVIYCAGQAAAVSTVPVNGGALTKLADDADFLPAPTGNRVALIELVESGPAATGLRVATLSSGADLFSYDAVRWLENPTFLADGNGILFVERTPTDLRRLRFLSATHPDTVVLGEWLIPNLKMVGIPFGPLYFSYPIDPTGCFTIVDTDQAPGPGTRLVLLP